MLGLVVNPVAGVGGPAGLAGSDGEDVQRRAAARGARPHAGDRATQALRALARTHPDAVVLTAGGAMGEDAVRAAGLAARVVWRAEDAGSVSDVAAVTPVAVDVAGAAGVAAGPTVPGTTGADTTAAVRALVAAGADLVLFAGGDGTARDVAAGLGTGDASSPASTPVGAGDPRGVGSPSPAALGIPSGVKMYSPVFALSPAAAASVAAAWLDGPVPVASQEVLDIDEHAMRRAHVSPTLYALMTVPAVSGRTQARKAAVASGEASATAAAARGARQAMRSGVRYLIGPGSTMAELSRQLGVDSSPLGVDVVLDGRLVCAQADEQRLLDEASRGPAQAVVTVIGGQGFVLGRGNQQLSARVIRALGPDPLMIVASQQKLVALAGRPLLVDTGDAATDAALEGFAPVITAPRTTSLYPVRAPELHQPTGIPESDPTTPNEGAHHAS